MQILEPNWAAAFALAAATNFCHGSPQLKLRRSLKRPRGSCSWFWTSQSSTRGHYHCHCAWGRRTPPSRALLRSLPPPKNPPRWVPTLRRRGPERRYWPTLASHRCGLGTPPWSLCFCRLSRRGPSVLASTTEVRYPSQSNLVRPSAIQRPALIRPI
jgi:hypothetical protein